MTKEETLNALRVAEMTLLATECQLDEVLCDSSRTNEECALARLAYDIAKVKCAAAEEAWLSLCED